jgi:hypothetical protein
MVSTGRLRHQPDHVLHSHGQSGRRDRVRDDRSEIAEFTPLVPGVRLSEPTINGRTARQSAGKSLGVGVGPPHQISGTSWTRR